MPSCNPKEIREDKEGEMKPSDRIKQIMIERDINGGLWAEYVPAIIQYLDELAEQGEKK